MKKTVNKIISFLIFSVIIFSGLGVFTSAENETKSVVENADVSLYGEAKSVILIEAETGKVLYEHNADERLAPASVTKIMTILLVAEEIEQGTLKLTDVVQVSENASSMGGSQVFLEAGEEITVEDLLKSVIIASANDAATALAEKVSGSVEGFVSKMNSRAKELKMDNTVFENPTGLDDSTVDHKTTARDISLMSRELMKHKFIQNYTTIWMDTIRNGEFGLTNTNRLIRFYSGANGLKTGSTAKAGFCISATAQRDGMQLIAVIMGAPNRDIRNEIAKKLLDYGFANYKYFCFDKTECEPLKVVGGVASSCRIMYDKFDLVMDKSAAAKGISTEIKLPESVSAPVEAGEVVGTVEYKVGENVVGTVNIVSMEKIEKINYFGLLKKMIIKFFFG